MPDLRVKYLQIVEQRTLLYNTVCTCLLCVPAAVGLVLEPRQQCNSNPQFWLLVTVVKSMLKLITQCYVSCRGGEHQRNVRLCDRFLTMLDLLGILWFVIGNILVFYALDCIKGQPIVMIVSLVYIISSYVGVLAPTIARFSFCCWMVSDPDDVAYLRLTDHLHWESEFTDLRYPPGPEIVPVAPIPEAVYSPDLTPERAQHWEEWLRTYGCFSVSYHPDMNLGNAGEGKAGRNEIGQASKVYTLIPTSVDGEQGDIELGQVRVETEPNGGPIVDKGERNMEAGAADHMGEVQVTCSVCLQPFEAPKNGVPAQPTQPTQPRQPGHTAAGQKRHNSIGGAHSGGAYGVVNATNASDNSSTPAESSGVVEDGNIIVRYPCSGHHYFHAHCLHSWLQVCSARYLNSRRGNHGRTDYHLQVTCPCCREHPHSIS